MLYNVSVLALNGCREVVSQQAQEALGEGGGKHKSKN